MKKFQIKSRARHLRYLYFIDERYSYSDLLKLMNNNQNFWGGRYNPIVPVKNNSIADGYVNLIKS
ncbi:hypothetical protein [Dyadobacter sp. 3J3]|uniref:hypothetical protein n=1 Tax=Dyadobacter sp. 3J3 TaxID=2606600 RepID=UPI00135727BC|nr:hypothetical protein [Dyadobacter sp. 3J3]